MADFNKDRKGTGTKEWSESSFNILNGCPNNCQYCYSKYNAIYRFKNIKDENEWIKPKVNMNKVNKKWNKEDGVIMFPTIHDIIPEFIDETITCLKNMLRPGNDVLIVSKPRIDCIKKICTELKSFKNNILFRFTIGNVDNSVLSLVEPGAQNLKKGLNH